VRNSRILQGRKRQIERPQLLLQDPGHAELADLADAAADGDRPPMARRPAKISGRDRRIKPGWQPNAQPRVIGPAFGQMMELRRQEQAERGAGARQQSLDLALHGAVAQADAAVAEAALASGANVNATDAHGDTALKLAAAAEATDVVGILVEAGGKFTAAERAGSAAVRAMKPPGGVGDTCSHSQP
jgi:hypothetical protein